MVSRGNHMVNSSLLTTCRPRCEKKRVATIGDTSIGVHGYIALGLGAVATLVIGGGLMWLVFYSARRGYDERAGRDPESE